MKITNNSQVLLQFSTLKRHNVPQTMRLLFFFVFVLSASLCQAQEVFAVDYASRADVKVFVVDYASRADLKVFKVDYSGQASGNEGLWYFTDYSGQADKTIFYVDYESQADLKIFFVEYKGQAGWNSNSKKHLMY